MTIIQKTATGATSLEQIASRFATGLGKGDTLFLMGDLGAGKSTFARAVIRAIAGVSDLEVPSPTFPLLIPYQTTRMEISHFDLYRLSDRSEVEELGLYDNLNHHLTLIEWPEQLSDDHQIEDRFEISLKELDQGESRKITIRGFGSAEEKLARFQNIEDFLKSAGWSEANWAFLQGDASTRSYMRLKKNADEAANVRRALLMNAPPQPDGAPIKNGKPYSQIAHLAENMTSFVAVSKTLAAAGLTVPEVQSYDIEKGLLLINDLGDDQYFHLITEQGQNQQKLYEPAIDVLVKVRQLPPAPVNFDNLTYQLPAYDDEALSIESELVIDWYWPVVKQSPISEEGRGAYQAIWKKLFNELKTNNRHWVLRDFHSPNLMHIKGRTGIESVGIIDFQDAVIGHPAYDVVSLCQDARLMVKGEMEQRLKQRYLEQVSISEPDFDKEDFQKAYAILGAQRASKLLGIFVRLSVRDGKSNYLTHIPRIWDYLERNLQHSALSELAEWYQINFPPELRAEWFNTNHQPKMPNLTQCKPSERAKEQGKQW